MDVLYETKTTLKGGEKEADCLEISLQHSSAFPAFSFCPSQMGARENGNQEMLYRNLPSLAKEQNKEQTSKTENF